MDHLLRPEGTESLIKVTYNVNKSGYYDGQGFFNFPQRRGWTEQDLLGVNGFGNRSDKDVEDFFQTWLLFGMTIEILKAAGIDANTEVFLSPAQGASGRVVTTEPLRAMLVQWKANWPLPEGVSPNCTCKSWINPHENVCREPVCWKNFPHARDSEAWRTTSQILDRACVFTDRYCTYTNSRDKGKKSDNTVWPVREEVVASILALGYGLRAAAISIYDIPRMGNEWGKGSSSLLREILSKKWCKFSAAVAMDDLQIDGQYYVAASPSPSQGYLNAHSECNEDKCISKVEEATYNTLHAVSCTNKDSKECPIHFCYGVRTDGKGGNEKDWPVPTEFEKELARVITVDGTIKAGDTIDIEAVGTPIIRWDEEGQEVSIVEFNEKKGSKPPYIAISHVWLDGMGNKHINSIPKCQLSRIQRMVDEVPFPDRQEGEKVGFWLDTLCVPVRKPFHNEKKWSIQRMRRIYEKAAAVLVIDSWMCQLESTAPLPDRCLATYMSNWQSRLWTFQEGCLAKALYFRFSDRAEHHRDLTDRRMAYEESMNAGGIYGYFCALSDNKVTFALTLMKQTVDMFVSGKESRRKNMWMLYLPLGDNLGHRQTTNLSDETVCLSTILGMDPGPYLDIRGEKDEPDADVAERRMEKFLRQIRIFNTGLIFGNYPRMSQNGFRWAPRSLLGARMSSIGAIEDQQKGCLKRIGSHKGLIVRYPGTMGKLAVLLSAKEQNAKTFVISERGAGTDVHYSIESWSGDCLWDENTVYGLVFTKKPEPGEESRVMIGRQIPQSRSDNDDEDDDDDDEYEDDEDEDDEDEDDEGEDEDDEDDEDEDEDDEEDEDEETDINFLRYECNAIIKARSGPPPQDALVLFFYLDAKWMII